MRITGSADVVADPSSVNPTPIVVGKPRNIASRAPTVTIEAGMSKKQPLDFAGKEIDVRFDGRLCIHVGECGHSAGDLFVAERQPWCMPDVVSKAEVREIVERCPSGALTYTDKAGTPESPPAENSLTVAYNGPLYLTGDLEIEGAGDDMPGVRFRAALCRCGASKNKPFCDNSHIEAKFEDYGAVGENGPGLDRDGRQARRGVAARRPARPERKSEYPRRQRSACLAGRQGVSLSLRGVEEQALLRRKPQEDRLQGLNRF